MNESSLGMARIDEAIPWDDCPYTKSNAILSSVLVLIGFSDLVCRDHPWGHPWDAASVDPSTLGAKTLYKLAFLKYCYTT